MIALAVIAVVVSVVAIVVSWLSYRASRRSAVAADRSASAAESAEHRARTPRLTVMLAGPPGMADRTIYRLRNDSAVDLDEVTVARPRPPDRIEYHLAVTGSGWADDEISLGPVAMTLEARFTLSCGVAEDLPEFHVRIECRAGSETWTLTEQLPSPRAPGLSPEERAQRKQILTHALDELEIDLATLRGADWHTVPLRDESFELARRLMVEHAPDWIGPVRDARSGIDEFRAWNAGPSSRLQSDIDKHVAGLSALLTDSRTTLQNLRAALDVRQASGVRWQS